MALGKKKKQQEKLTANSSKSEKPAPKEEPVQKYKVYFELEAQQEFGHLDASIRDNFIEPIRRMKQRPSQDATNLRNVKSTIALYKKRVGDFRIFFAIDRGNKQVVVLSIKKRDSDTYDPSILDSIAKRYSGPHREQPKKKK